MKKYIRSTRTLSDAEKLHKLVYFLRDEGVSYWTMLDFLLSEMSSQEGIEKMKELAAQCDVDLEEFWDSIG